MNNNKMTTDDTDSTDREWNMFGNISLFIRVLREISGKILWVVGSAHIISLKQESRS